MKIRIGIGKSDIDICFPLSTDCTPPLNVKLADSGQRVTWLGRHPAPPATGISSWPTTRSSRPRPPVRGHGPPDFALHQHMTFRSQRLHGRSACTHHGVGAKQDFPAPRSHANRTRKTVIPPNPALTAMRHPGTDAHLRHRRGHQRKHAKGEAHNAGNRQRAMAAKLCLQQQQHQRRHQQQNRRKPDGQQVQRKHGQQHHQRSQRAGHDRSRRVEFQVDQQRPAHQEQQRDVGIDKPAQQSSRSGGRITSMRAPAKCSVSFDHPAG